MQSSRWKPARAEATEAAIEVTSVEPGKTSAVGRKVEKYPDRSR